MVERRGGEVLDAIDAKDGPTILIILSPDADASGGDWTSRLNGFAQAYYLFKDAGVEIALASRAGGWPWPGSASRNPETTDSLARFAQDAAAREELADTLSLDQVCIDDFEGAYCVSLPGPIWRSEDEASVEALIGRFLKSGKPVAIIPSVLDLAPHGAGDGLLITGEAAGSARLAAQTLLAAAQAQAAAQDRPSGG